MGRRTPPRESRFDDGPGSPSGSPHDQILVIWVAISVLLAIVVSIAAGVLGWLGDGLIIPGVIVGTVFLGVRLSLQTIVVLWSLHADAAGRRHALAVLRVLRFSGAVRGWGRRSTGG